MKNKYSTICLKERCSLTVTARLYIDEFDEGHQFYQKQFQSNLRPNHKLK